MKRLHWRGYVVVTALLAATLAFHVASIRGAGIRVAAATPAAAQGAAPDEIHTRFEQAVVMLHAKRYDEAIVALHRVLALAPQLPEAHANMGYALLGLERFAAAADFFNAAIELRPKQANAYYGLALAAEGRHDLPSALGAMRSFLHLSAADHPHRARARAAIWEWETQLGRAPLTSAKDLAPATPTRGAVTAPTARAAGQREGSQ